MQAAPGQHDGWTRQDEFFLPIYEIECDGNGLGYELEINAITGEVLESEVESYSIFDELYHVRGDRFFLPPNRHDKIPGYTRGRHILLIEKERTSYDTMERVWQPHPRIE